MNPLLAKVTGKVLQEDDVVPVPGGAMTRRFYRDRSQRNRVQREDEDSSDLQRVIGESGNEEKGVIPDSAEEIDDAGISVLPKKMRAIKDVVQEPSHPHTDREKLLTPYAALTAPDATPDAMSPIDPTKVPGKSATFFTASELEKAEPAAEEGAPDPTVIDEPGVDKATRTMDILLGRTRASKPAANSAEAAQAGAITTEAAAYAALNIKPVLSESAGAAIGAAMVPGTPMPEPTRTDAKVVCDAFRKYMG
jgi:hypothetical protein